MMTLDNIWTRTAAGLVVGAIAVVVLVSAARTRGPDLPSDETDSAASTSSVAGDAALSPEAVSGDAVPAPVQAPPTGPPIQSTTNDYRIAVIAVNDEIAAQLGDLTDLMVVPQYDNATWLEQMTTVLTAMQASADRARTITPPEGFAAAHAVWLDGIAAYEWTAENMAVAIHGPDYALLDQCNQRLTDASAAFRQATELMNAAGGP